MTSPLDQETLIQGASAAPLLQVNSLSVGFPTAAGIAYAVRDLSFSLSRGEVLGLVGESGCGKSMTSLAILGLVPTPGQITQGEILFEGEVLNRLSPKAYQKIRGRKIALIPQDPLTSLNPVYTVGSQIIEVLKLHQGLSGQAARVKAAELLDQVKLPNATNRLDDYPHQFSGGMRQRVMIAMALSCEPSLLIADEPTTALDVTVQAQILALLSEIQRENGMAILLITHDLGVVAETCHNVAVMYAGRIVEEAPVADLFKSPLHPYTQGLMQSLPSAERKRLIPIEGQPPALTEIPPGCSFAPRCPYREPRCTVSFPETHSPSPGHTVSCVRY